MELAEIDGRALRERVPRASHAAWEPPAQRDPIAVLRAGDANRLPELIPIRYGRMLTSPFAFFRGAAAVMAADLAGTPSTGIRVQACGDCHLQNFGGFETPERRVIFDINDFDETLPAAWEWDVKRLAASFVLASRANGHAEFAARDAALAGVRAYRESVRGFAGMDVLDVWYARMDADDFFLRLAGRDRTRVERAFRRAETNGSAVEVSKLTEVVDGKLRIRDNPPLIFHASPERKAEFGPRAERAMESYRASLTPDRRVLLNRYRYVDAAIKVVGIGSVGTRCWIVLLMSDDGQPFFLQFKQASASVLEAFAGKSEFAGGGERVVVGQHLMQAASDFFLGWFDTPEESYYVRQLRDAKVSPPVAAFDERAMRAYAGACSWNLARAHAKTGDARAIAAYLGKGREFDEAVAAFAVAYADQTVRDHDALKAAVTAREIVAAAEG